MSSRLAHEFMSTYRVVSFCSVIFLWLERRRKKVVIEIKQRRLAAKIRAGFLPANCGKCQSIAKHHIGAAKTCKRC